MRKFIEVISQEMEQAFEAAGYDPSLGRVTVSSRPDLCEYQCNGAMAGAKKYHKAPFMIAEDVAGQLRDSEVFSSVEVVRPGFINLKIAEAFLTVYLMQMKDAERFGMPAQEAPSRIILDYGGPNVAKPLHVGHLRSAVIGESIKRICRYHGEEVIGDIHLGDWGLQMGLVITELQDRQPDLPYFDPDYSGDYPEEAPFTVSELEEIYTYASKKSKEDPDYYARAMEATHRLQEGEREIVQDEAEAPLSQLRSRLQQRPPEGGERTAEETHERRDRGKAQPRRLTQKPRRDGKEHPRRDQAAAQTVEQAKAIHRPQAPVEEPRKVLPVAPRPALEPGIKAQRLFRKAVHELCVREITAAQERALDRVVAQDAVFRQIGRAEEQSVDIENALAGEAAAVIAVLKELAADAAVGVRAAGAGEEAGKVRGGGVGEIRRDARMQQTVPGSHELMLPVEPRAIQRVEHGGDQRSGRAGREDRVGVEREKIPHVLELGRVPDVEVTVNVKNTGSRDGDEVVQLYVVDPLASTVRPRKQLRAFDRVFVKAGETVPVTLKLGADAFSLVNAAGDTVTERGDFILQVGASSEDIRLTETITY